jgi:uncharacterized protein YdhG (YjbR/CyaY superfamily)
MNEKIAKNISDVDSDFTKKEQAAMREQIKMEARAKKDRATGEEAISKAVAALPEPDRSIASKINEIVSKTAPVLMPRTWYGFPAYANKDGKIVCFFQPSSKFKTRYATFGFQQDAKLDDGNMWPVAFAVTKLTPADEEKIIEFLKKAVS